MQDLLLLPFIVLTKQDSRQLRVNRKKGIPELHTVLEFTLFLWIYGMLNPAFFFNIPLVLCTVPLPHV